MHTDNHVPALQTYFIEVKGVVSFYHFREPRTLKVSSPSYV